MGEGSFLYFGFGSNLSKERLRINCPSAEFVSIARLPGYRLAFRGYSYYWKGATATIFKTEEKEAEVWGVVWRISEKNSAALDIQESTYRRLQVNVSSPEGGVLTCRTYEKLDMTTVGEPSVKYLDTILTGAKENSLPEQYMQLLQQIEHNGYDGPVIVH